MYHRGLLQIYFGYALILCDKGHAENYCPLPPKDGMCAKSTTTFDDKKELMHSMENGTCTVWNTLCSYHQGCADLPVMKWTTKVDFVEVKGQNGCQEIYSVLQSPSLDLPETFCLKIKIVQSLPSLLVVFLVKNEGVTTLFNQSTLDVLTPTEFFFTLPANQAKIMFRARSGGSDAGYVQLHSVKLDLGTCNPLGCFHGSSKTPFCGWSMQNWNVTSTSRAFVSIANTTGTMTSFLTSATMAESHCLYFQYQLSGDNSTLSVFLEPFPSEHHQLLWSLTSNDTTSEMWEQASIGLNSNVTFKIMFKGIRCGSHNSSISIRDVQYKTKTNCLLTPMEANKTTEQIHQCIYESDGERNSNIPLAANVTIIVVSSICAIVVIIILFVVTFYLRRKKINICKMCICIMDHMHYCSAKEDDSGTDADRKCIELTNGATRTLTSQNLYNDISIDELEVSDFHTETDLTEIDANSPDGSQYADISFDKTSSLRETAKRDEYSHVNLFSDGRISKIVEITTCIDMESDSEKMEQFRCTNVYDKLL